MSKLYQSGCCGGCGSPACGGACSQGAVKPAPVTQTPPSEKTLECDLTMKLPAPKLPAELCVEICGDDGGWFAVTMPTPIAAVLMSANIARMASSAPPVETDSFDPAEFFETAGLEKLFQTKG